jgi:hypothetical protein
VSRAERKLRLIKLGGSLLELDDLTDRLRRWLAIDPDAMHVLVVGGGREANLVRERDQRHELSESEAHWMAIGAMELNSRALAAKLPEARWLDRIGDARRIAEPLGILNPLSFLLHDDPRHPLGGLPAGWSVTSDSIAARAAEMAGASELVLLKSAFPPKQATREQLAAVGYVDAFFPEASRCLLCVRFVNLRDKDFGTVLVFCSA